MLFKLLDSRQVREKKRGKFFMYNRGATGYNRRAESKADSRHEGRIEKAFKTHEE